MQERRVQHLQRIQKCKKYKQRQIANEGEPINSRRKSDIVILE